MLLTVSNDIGLIDRLNKIYYKNGLFSVFSRLDNISNIVESKTLSVDFAIVDATLSRESSDKVCSYLRQLFPSIRIGVILKKRHTEDAMFTYVKNSDEQIFFPFSDEQFSCFLKKFVKNTSPLIPSESLRISPEANDLILLGYRLRLTKTEFRLMLLCINHPDSVFSPDEIVRLAFSHLGSRPSPNQIAVHVCSINKKAANISGNKLIINLYKKGYTLNS